MEISLITQFQIFLVSVVFGATLGLAYDFLRIHRVIADSDRFSVNLQDILFFIITGILTFLFIIIMTHGTVRFYIILSEFIGFVIYRCTLGNILLKLFLKILLPVKKACLRLYLIIFIPVLGFFKKYFSLSRTFIKGKFKNIKNLQKN